MLVCGIMWPSPAGPAAAPLRQCSLQYAMTQLSLALLGPPQIELDGQPVAGFEYAKVRALLVFLVVERTRPHARDAVAELLWPDQPPQVARNSLRQALAKLRQAIRDHAADPPFLLITRETLQFNAGSSFALDTASFGELAEAAERCPHNQPEPCAECVGRWERAVALYRGPFLDQAAPRDSLGFEEWALVQRERFERQATTMLDALAAHYERRGDGALALRYARRYLELDPWNEAIHRQVMRVLARAGQRSAALAHYAHCRRVLAEDLGVEPEDETVALYEQVRDGASGNGQRELPLVPNPQSPISNLPAQPTSFIGREAELEELGALLAEPACRLITVVGPGGIGKTRLALRAAEMCQSHFAGGVAWVPLAALSGTEQIVGAITHALDLAIDEAADPLGQLSGALAGRELLLLLDNFEHLLGAGQAARLVAALLERAPGVKLLTTSREPLQLQSEWLFDIRGLPYPTRASQSDALVSAAAQLFLDRARQQRRSALLDGDAAQAVARICQLVEGMPLALELAASASREQPYTAIAQAIGQNLDVLQAAQWDRPERHQSMRAAFEYSWRMLSPEQQRALAALSVFRGTFSPEAAEAIASELKMQNEKLKIPADDDSVLHFAFPILHLLEALADKSLLYRAANGRYAIHELIRQFAAEQLAAGEELAARARHLAYFAGHAEAIEPRLRGAEQQAALDELARDHDNLRAAIDWALAVGQREQAGRAAGALWRFWWIRGYVREGRQRLEQLVGGQAGDDLSVPVRAKVLNALGALVEEQGDFAQAAAWYEASLALYRALGDAAGTTSALNNLGGTRYKQGDFARAAECLAETAALARAQGDRYGTAAALHNLAGVIYDSGGDLARARALLEEALAIWDEIGMRQGTATTLSSLGQMALIGGDNPAAARYFTQSLDHLRALGDQRSVSMSLTGLGRVSHRLGEQAAALAAYHEALALRHELGDKLGVAECFEGIGEVALAHGAPERALRLYGAAAVIREAIGSPVLPIDRDAYESALAAARAALGERAAGAAWEAGHGLALDAAVAEALES
jgi:DNA-binding SARP family transcriptional activator/predicted ATPase